MKKRHETINKIVLNARELFLECGYKNVTVQKIADKSGITKGLVTHYFPKKSDVLSAINFKHFMQIREFVKKYAEEDALLQYMMTTYILRKIQYSNEKYIKLSKETFLTQNNVQISDYSSHDSIYVEILKQFNMDTTLAEFHKKIIMGIGAQKELTHVYLNKIIDMSLEEFLEDSISIMCTILGIPEFLINQNYDKMKNILDDNADFEEFLKENV